MLNLVVGKSPEIAELPITDALSRQQYAELVGAQRLPRIDILLSEEERGFPLRRNVLSRDGKYFEPRLHHDHAEDHIQRTASLLPRVFSDPLAPTGRHIRSTSAYPACAQHTRRLVDLSVADAGLLAIVIEHRLEAGPVCVSRGSGHLGFCQLRAADMSDVGFTASVYQFATEFVQSIRSAVPDSGVSCSNALLKTALTNFDNYPFVSLHQHITRWYLVGHLSC